ncbi:MAG TPA: hypothetical protein VMT77_00170 [Gemmatimonadales bacterium]|nr:hypothetical protein [Gemmatimonadales bacterium]
MSGEKDTRDWDKEMAQIDKLIASGAADRTPPAAAPAAAAPAARARAAAPAAPAGVKRSSVVFTWVRLILGLAAGIGMTQWPYERGCGVLLFVYLAAVGGVIVAGLWSAVSSWRTRSAFAHALSLGLVCWGGLLGAREVLPRVGYARTSAAWFCPAGSAPAPGTRTPPAAPAPTSATPQKSQGAF